jgi:diguanylate cyclase (GGDEF)-like protein
MMNGHHQTPMSSPASRARSLTERLGLGKRKRLEANLRYQALHDPVTGLLNRTAILDRLGHAVDTLARSPGRLALFFADLDNFKDINDGSGHEVGDKVLIEVGRRLTASARREDTVCRLGGDEFVVLREGLADADDLRVIGERILEVLHNPISVDGCELVVTCSLGAVMATDAQASPSELLRYADAAMYGAKRAGRGCLQVFDVETKSAVTAKMGLVAELRQAIDNKDLYVAYQPVFSLVHGRVVGAEALVRWEHKERGNIPPSEFIQLAEERGLIDKIDGFVIDEACRQLAQWRSSTGAWEGFTMGVNISSRQFNDLSLVNRVDETLEKYALPPHQLCVEITETSLIAEMDTANLLVDALRILGVGVALDDFGTGYSALVHLQQLNTSVIKIDRSFIAKLGAHSRDSEIVGAVIAMAHALGMQVIGEGIESETQLRALTDLNCEAGQGYFFSPALAPEEIVRCKMEADARADAVAQTRESRSTLPFSWIEMPKTAVVCKDSVLAGVRVPPGLCRKAEIQPSRNATSTTIPVGSATDAVAARQAAVREQARREILALRQQAEQGIATCRRLADRAAGT